jgi:membrane protein implicated in regulation of membrane protease activity
MWFEIISTIALFLGVTSAALYAVWPFFKEYERQSNEAQASIAESRAVIARINAAEAERKARSEAWTNRPRRPIREDA